MTFKITTDAPVTAAPAHILMRLTEAENMGKGLYRGRIQVVSLDECSVTCEADFRSTAARETFCDIWLSLVGPASAPASTGEAAATSGSADTKTGPDRCCFCGIPCSGHY